MKLGKEVVHLGTMNMMCNENIEAIGWRFLFKGRLGSGERDFECHVK